MPVKTPLKIGDFVEIENSCFPENIGKIGRVSAIRLAWDNPYEVSVGPWQSVYPRDDISNALTTEELARRLNIAVAKIASLQADNAQLGSDNERLMSLVEPDATFRH